MIRRLWYGFLRLIGWGRGKPGKGNKKVIALYHQNYSGWVMDVTGVVVWVKQLTDEERVERRRRFWRHMWRSFIEFFGATPDHTNRYPHQIFNIEIENSDGLVVRVENNLYTGKELKPIEKGMRVEAAGEYLPNHMGGKLHHTHGRKGYVRER